MSINIDSSVIEVNTHGFNCGTVVRTAVWDEYKYGDDPKVKRIASVVNSGLNTSDVGEENDK